MTAGFWRAARRAGIGIPELQRAVRQLTTGCAADLGGGVLKVRLRGGRYRAVALARGRRGLYFVYLFAKQDQSTLAPAELRQFRELAKAYETLTSPQLEALLHAKSLREIPIAASSIQEPRPPGRP